MVRGSMYLEEYLDACEAGEPVSIGTFLTRALRGRARDYSGQYYQALHGALQRELRAGHVEIVPSVRGSIAYRRVSPDTAAPAVEVES